MQEVYVPFRPPGARKTARFGHRREKPNQRLRRVDEKTARYGPFFAENQVSAIGGKNRINGCEGPEISVVLPLGIIRIDEKTARYGPFFAENQFSPADEFVLVGLVVRKCHFDVTACAEARRLDN